jgi:UDP-N-acetylglucosamine 2-epimerase (non-hydrolysing)
MKVMSLVGARPQYVKEAALNSVFRNHRIKEILVNSGQHYDYNMAGVFFKTLGISKPDYNLKVGSGKHGEMTGKIMTEFEKVAEKERPDLILVFGDTNTTLAGALVAAKLKIKLGHVEAGLRSIPKDMPEQINRVVTDHVADLLFAPSVHNIDNLKKEGITKGVYFTGDVMYDIFLKMRNKFNLKINEKLKLEEDSYVVVTLHRDYNVDIKAKLKRILIALNEINNEKRIVFPMHPRTKKRIENFRLSQYTKDLLVLEPLEYLDLMGLVAKSYRVITDSGGLQKEAYFSNKHGLTLMPDCGWPELIESGNNLLCDESNILRKFHKANKVHIKKGIYGNGDAGEKIAKIILK